MIDLDPTNVPKIWKLEVGVKKLRGSDIEWSNPYGDQATHFVSALKTLLLKILVPIVKKQ
jgi:hypothetical protein